jgi:hypothetical protein
MFAIWSLPIIVSTFVSKSAFPLLNDINLKFRAYGTLVTLMGLALGTINFGFVQIREVRARRRGMRGEIIWPFALYSLVLMIVVAIIGITQGTTYGTIAQQGYAIFVTPGLVSIFGSQVIQFIWIAFKRFRITNIETGLLYFGAVVGLLFGVPLGTAIWPGFADLGSWLVGYPASGFARALQLTIAAGTIAYFVRVLIGLERSGFGAD